MSDYYSHKPLHTLEKPLALAALPGCNGLATAQMISRFTGLPLVLLDRQVEHISGTRIDTIVTAGGRSARHKLELPILQKATQKRVHPVIALGDTTLTDPQAHLFLRGEATIVGLTTTLPVLHERICKRLERDPRRWLRYFAGEAPTLASLAPLHTELDLLLQSCHHTVDVGSRSALRVAQQLMTELGMDGSQASE